MESKVSKVVSLSRGVTRRLPFQELIHRDVGEGATPSPGLLHFTLDTYFILLSVKQGAIYIYPTPSFEQDMTQGQFLSGV